MSTPESPLGPVDDPKPEEPEESLIERISAPQPDEQIRPMSSTWEEFTERVPTGSPSSSDAPTGGEKIRGEAGNNREVFPGYVEN
jgi:hypothetical protein